MNRITTLLALFSVFSVTVWGQLSAQNIPYVLGKNYFVKNTIADGQLAYPKITSQQEFDEIFGMATTMGTDGTPTAIDFSKQFAIAVVDSESSNKIRLEPSILTTNNEIINFIYTKDVEEQESYFTSRHCLIIIVDNKYKGDVKIERSYKEELIPFEKADRYFVKNTVAEGLIEIPMIASQAKFNEYFGTAPVMGKKGNPTVIDFKKEFVIAIINRSTEKIPKTNIDGLTKKDGVTTLAYTIQDDNLGSSFRDCFILIVQNKYKGNVRFLKLN